MSHFFFFFFFIAGDSVKFPGKEGDIIYSKNNVCVHPAVNDAEPSHVPGYLTLHCQKDEVHIVFFAAYH